MVQVVAVVSENGIPGIPNQATHFDTSTQQTRRRGRARRGSPHRDLTAGRLLPARWTPGYPQLTPGRREALKREGHPTAQCSPQASQSAVPAFLDKDIRRPVNSLGCLK